LHVKVKTEGYFGVLQKSISIVSNATNQPKLNLVVSLRVIGSVQILPVNRLVLRYKQEPPIGHLLIRQDPTETGELNVSDVIASEDWLELSVRKLEEATKIDERLEGLPGDWLLEATVPDRPQAGMSRATIKFKTGLTREPVFSIPITVTSRQFGVPSTRRLDLNWDEETGITSGRMTFDVMSGLLMANVEVSVTPEEYEVETKQLTVKKMEVIVRSKEPQGKIVLQSSQIMVRFQSGNKYVTVPARRVTSN
jgi:hypothetical protein